MAGKAILVFCAQALIIKSAVSQCLNRGIAGIGPGINAAIAPGLAGPYGAGCGAVASTGGGFAVNSFSPVPPTGLTVRSENSIEGSLSVGGEVPFLGTVALEGILPTAGAGAISYGCGSGAIGITSEGPINTGITTPGTYGPVVAGPAYGAGIAGPAFGPGIAGPAFGAGIAGPAFGPGIAGPAFGPGIAGPAFGPGIAGPAFGAGIAGPAFGAGIAGPAFGAGIAGPAFGAGIAGPGFGAGYGPGLGFNGFGIGL